MDETNPAMIAVLVFCLVVSVVMLLTWWLHGFAFPGIGRFFLYLLIAFVLGGGGAGAAFVVTNKQ